MCETFRCCLTWTWWRCWGVAVVPSGVGLRKGSVVDYSIWLNVINYIEPQGVDHEWGSVHTVWRWSTVSSPPLHMCLLWLGWSLLWWRLWWRTCPAAVSPHWWRSDLICIWFTARVMRTVGSWNQVKLWPSAEREYWIRACLRSWIISLSQPWSDTNSWWAGASAAGSYEHAWHQYSVWFTRWC